MDSPQTIRLIDPSSGHEFATLEPRDPQNLSWLAFSPDGARLAATTWTKAIQVWDFRVLCRELASMDLDWKLPSHPGGRDGLD